METQTPFTNSGAMESYDSIQTMSEASYTVEHQRGVGRTQNRFDTWLGGKFERAIGRVASRKTRPEPTTVLSPFIMNNSGAMDSDYSIRTMSVVSITVKDQRGAGVVSCRIAIHLGCSHLSYCITMSKFGGNGEGICEPPATLYSLQGSALSSHS